MALKGFSTFVNKYLNCPNDEERQALVLNELAKTRAKIDARANAYTIRKCVWKLLLARSLGFDVSFAERTVPAILSQKKDAFSNLGTVALEHLFANNSDIVTLATQFLYSQVVKKPDHLAYLKTVIALANKELSDLLFSHVQTTIFSGTVSSQPVPAVLALVRFQQLDPTTFQARLQNENLENLLTKLEEEKDVVLLRHVVLLLTVLAPARSFEERKAICLAVVKLAKSIVLDHLCHPYYVFHGVLAPNLLVTIFRFLSSFSIAELPLQLLRSVLERVQKHSEINADGPRSTAVLAILFASLELIVALLVRGADPSFLADRAVDLIARYISVRDPNLRLAGLRVMSSLLEIPATKSRLLKYREVIASLVADADSSISHEARRSLFLATTEPYVADSSRLFLRCLEHEESVYRALETVKQLVPVVESFSTDFDWTLSVHFRVAITLDKLFSVTGNVSAWELQNELRAEFVDFFATKLGEQKNKEQALSVVLKLAKETLPENLVATQLFAEAFLRVSQTFDAISERAFTFTLERIVALIHLPSHSHFSLQTISHLLQTALFLAASFSKTELVEKLVLCLAESIAVVQKKLTLFVHSESDEKTHTFLQRLVFSHALLVSVKVNELLAVFTAAKNQTQDSFILTIESDLSSKNTIIAAVEQHKAMVRQEEALSSNRRSRMVTDANIADSLGFRKTQSYSYNTEVENAKKLPEIVYQDSGKLFENKDIQVFYIVAPKYLEEFKQNICRVALLYKCKTTNVSGNEVIISFGKKTFDILPYSTSQTEKVVLKKKTGSNEQQTKESESLLQWIFFKYKPFETIPTINFQLQCGDDSHNLCLYLPISELHFFYKSENKDNTEVLSIWQQLECNLEFSLETSFDFDFIIKQVERFFYIYKPSSETEFYIIGKGNFLNENNDLLFRITFIQTAKAVKLLVIKTVSNSYNIIDRFKKGLNILFRIKNE